MRTATSVELGRGAASLAKRAGRVTPVDDGTIDTLLQKREGLRCGDRWRHRHPHAAVAELKKLCGLVVRLSG